MVSEAASTGRGPAATILQWIALGLVALVSVAGWVRLVCFPAVPTRPWNVVWKEPSGAAIAATRGGTLNCSQRGLQYVIDGTQVWTTCAGTFPQPPVNGGVILRIDAAESNGTLWSLPAGMELISTHAMLPGKEGTLAVAFYASGPDRPRGNVMAGIVNESGWAHEPIPLGPGVDGERVLGGAWVGPGAELAVTRPTTDERGERASPAIVRLALDGTQSEREISAEVLLEGLEASAAIQAAYHTPTAWHFLVRTGQSADEGALWDVREDGARVSTDVRVRGHVQEAIDLSAAGLEGAGERAVRVLLPDGRMVPPPAAPQAAEGWKLERRNSVIEVTDGVLGARPRWWARRKANRYQYDPDPGTTEIVDGRIVTTHCPESHLYLWPGPPAEHGAKAAATACYDHLDEPAWVPRPAGGYWLITGSGAYLTVNADMQRIDARNVVQQLWAEGKHGSEVDRPPAMMLVGMLVIMLLGLPGSVAGALIARLRRTKKPGAAPTHRRTWLWIACLFAYALVELASLAMLWERIA